MYAKVEQAEQHWLGTHSAIDQWLTARKVLLVQYCQLAGLPPFNKQDNELPSKDAIEQFCEQLMDYLSTGHFQVYAELLNECGKSAECVSLWDSTYPQIRASTDQAIGANDQFSAMLSNNDLSNFDHQLSKLGEVLEERFHHEDQLLERLHQRLN